jgi:hypothetical protein
MAGPPPLLHDDRLTLEQLGAMVREFDQLSAEAGGSLLAGDGLRDLAGRRVAGIDYSRGRAV